MPSVRVQQKRLYPLQAAFYPPFFFRKDIPAARILKNPLRFEQIAVPEVNQNQPDAGMDIAGQLALCLDGFGAQIDRFGMIADALFGHGHIMQNFQV